MEYLDIAIVIFSYNGTKPLGGGNFMSSFNQNIKFFNVCLVSIFFP